MKLFWFSLIVILLLSMSAVFAQSDVSATQAEEDDAAAIQNANQIQKVKEVDIRKVVVTGNVIGTTAPKAEKTNSLEAAANASELQKAETTNVLHKAEATTEVQFDDKGGAIIPNASEGIKFTSPDKEAKAKVSPLESKRGIKAQSTRPSSSKKVTKDLSSRNAAQEAAAKPNRNKDNQ